MIRGKNATVETGEMTINGAKMSWKMRRSEGESFFGIRGSRIYQLELKKDGKVVGKYERGWETTVYPEDETSTLCLSYLVDRYGRNTKNRKRKKEMGSLE